MGKYFVYDAETGEIIKDLGDNVDADRVVQLNYGELIYRPSQYRKFELTKMDIEYVKLNLKVAANVDDICHQVYKLVPFIGFKDNILKFSNGHYATIAGLAKRLGYNEEYFRTKLIKKMEKAEIIKITKFNGKRAIIMNPYIICKGKDILVEIKEMFMNSKWAS